MVEIVNYIILFLGDLFLSCYHVYCWTEISSESKKLIINKEYIISVILTAITLNLSSYIFTQPFRLIIISVLLIAINYFLISKEIKQSIISVVISQLILAFVETTFIIIASIIFGNKIDTIIYETIPFILLNCYITVISLIVCRTRSISKLFSLFYTNKNFKKNFEMLIYPIIIIFIMIIATIESHITIPFTLVLIFNTLIAVIFISIIIASQKLKEKYQKINSKYETSISSLKEYEVMIDKFRVDTHENKNEILTIRNMIKDNNDKGVIVKYIDKLVDNKIKDNDKIMKQTAKIPAGGLRATIYSKLCLMDKLKIKYKLNISREVKTTDLINLDEELVLKICKILGVFLDNAIDAVAKLKKKEITIEFYNMEGKLCIDITNNFKGNIDIDKMSDMKYSTKGKGRGYGLTLVNKLLEEESNRLENEKSISRDTFTQSLKIKM